MFLGLCSIDDLVTFTCNTHSPTTGAATDADSDPAYRVYEDETGTPILTGVLSKLDDANTTGFYSEQITLSAANGFENGKSYNIYIAAAVGAVTGTMHHYLQVKAIESNLSAVKTQTDKFSFDSDNYVLSHPSTSVIVGTNNDKTGYSLTSAYDPAKTASQDSDMATALLTLGKFSFDSDNFVYADSILSASERNSIADAILKRDWTSITGEASRSVLNALRFIRNKFSTTANNGFVTVYKEDDSTEAYQKALTTDSDAQPIVEG